MVKGANTDIIMEFTMKMRNPGLAIYPWLYSVSCPVMGYKVRWGSWFQMQFRAIAGFSFKHTYSVDSNIIYEHMKMTQQKSQEVNTAALVEWKLTVTPS